MSKRTRELLSKVSAAPKPAAAPTEQPAPRRSILAQRDTALSKIGQGKQRTVQLLMHPPSRIRMWSEHNRRYDLLSSERCADLIDGFKRTGRQEFPAIVRSIKDESFDYELICGARRHWTADYLKWDLMIEVRDLDDKQAFILQDLENRDREDISDFERALDYQKALPTYFNNSRTEMAKFLEIDPSNFGKLIDLADLPKTVVDAYGDLRDLKAHHGSQYKRLLADAATRRRVLDKARELKGQGLPGRDVIKELKKAAKTKAEVKSNAQYGLLTAQRQAAGTARVSLPAAPKDLTAEEFAQTLRADFDQFLSEWLDIK